MSKWETRVLRLMSDPRIAAVMVKAITLPGKLGAAWDEQLVRFARRMNLATRDEVARLEKIVGELKRELSDLEPSPASETVETGEE